jgi:hypothetical protein
MISLHKLLPDAEGADLIRKCWGVVPSFDGPCDIIHVSQKDHEILLTGVFLTNESGDGNECKPSLMLLRFSGVTHWDYDYGCAKLNGIEQMGIFASPPPGFIAIDVHFFHIVCRQVAILRCKHQPFTDLDDDNVAT